jgi:hypothetical protein
LSSLNFLVLLSLFSTSMNIEELNYLLIKETEDQRRKEDTEIKLLEPVPGE